MQCLPFSFLWTWRLVVKLLALSSCLLLPSLWMANILGSSMSLLTPKLNRSIGAKLPLKFMESSHLMLPLLIHWLKSGLALLKHGHTAGIGHGEKTARPEVVQCVSERVNIRNTTCRCVVCYKKQRKNKKRTRDEAMKSVRQSRLGCPACQKVVCTECWQEFQTAGHNMDLI